MCSRESSFASIIFNDGSIASVESVIYAMQPEDIAIVEAETGNHRPLPLGDVLNLKVGETVYAIGAPKGLSASLSSGLISAFRQGRNDVFLIQITATIAPGSSGGPLFDSMGQVVGITTSHLKDSDFGFAAAIGCIPCDLTYYDSGAVALSGLSPQGPESPIYELKPTTPEALIPYIAYSEYLHGWEYESGSKVPQDYREAAKWYRKAADLGSSQGQFSLGTLYYRGHGVPKDMARAVEYYRKAAAGGDADAQCTLAGLYHDGRGVPLDYELAYFWASTALSGNQVGTKSADASRLRDDAASHLSSQALSKIRAQIQNWMEHSTPSNREP